MNVPYDLAIRPNWIVWRSVVRNKKPTKLPFQAANGQVASTSEPSHWVDLACAQAAVARGGYTGLGFVFRRGEGIFGVDLDACYEGLYTLAPWAVAIIREFSTYAEISPSGYGVKLYGLGDWQGTGRVAQIGGETPWGKRAAVEIYGWGRYFAFTGNKLEDSPSELFDCQRKLGILIDTIVKGKPAPARTQYREVHGDDAFKVRRARAYLAKVPPRSDSIAGCNARTFRACCVLIHDMHLAFQDALALLVEWNMRSDNPWSPSQLHRKLDDAVRKGK